MLRYATCDLRCVLHMLCMYLATFHCPNAILNQWRGWGEKHLKLNWKTCFNFPMTNVTYLSIAERRYYTFWFKEHFYPFLNNSARLHFEKKNCIHGRNSIRLKDDTLGPWVENANFHNFANGELLWNIFWCLIQRGRRPRAYQKGNIEFKIDFLFDFVWFDSLRPINNLSVKQGRIFIGWTSTKLG